MATKMDAEREARLALTAQMMGIDVDPGTLDRADGIEVQHHGDHIVIGSVGKTSRYTIKRGRDGVVYCSCIAWKMKAKHGRSTCKHLTYLELNGIKLDD